MIDIGKDLQSAYDYGYRQGVKDTLDDIHKTFERSLREKFAHLIKTEPQTNADQRIQSVESVESVGADRKTEPTCSKMEQVATDTNIGHKDEPKIECLEWYDKVGNYHRYPKTEPQTELKGSKRLVKGSEEETEMERLERIDNELEDAWARIRELTDEPQTERSE